MKKTLFTTIASACFISVLLIASAHAQQPKTVTDFYMALPNDKYSHPYGKEITTKAEITKYRKSLIKIEDIGNGYLRLEPNESEGWTDIALFKKADGSYVVAHSEVSCGPGCDSELELFTFANGKWTNITSRYFPALSENEEKAKEEQGCLFELPRIGRTIKMICGGVSNGPGEIHPPGEEDDPDIKYSEFKFEWNGEKFVRK